MDANSLTVLPGGQDEDLSDVEYTEEGLRQFIAKFLKDKGDPADDITVDDVVSKPLFAKFRATCEQIFKKDLKEINRQLAKKRRQVQEAKNKVLAETADRLEAILRQEHGMPTALTQEEIQAKLRAPLADTTKPADKSGVQASGVEKVPSRVLALREQFGDNLPVIAFESADGATAVRRVIKYCVQNLRSKRQENGLEADYLDTISKLYNLIQDEKKGLFPMIDKVVVEGWGLELGKSPKNNQLFHEVARSMSDDVRFTAILKWIRNCPTPEELKAETMTEAQLADAKRLADTQKAAAEAEKQKRREEFRPLLKARLMEVSPGKSDQSAEQMAKHLARKYSHMANIKAMFTQAACDRKALAQKNKDEQAAVVTINLYLTAAGLTAEEFDAEFAQFNKEQGRNVFIKEWVGHGDNKSPAGPVSPLGNQTPPNGRKDHQRRKAAKSARDIAIRAGMKGKSDGSGRQKGGKK